MITTSAETTTLQNHFTYTGGNCDNRRYRLDNIRFDDGTSWNGSTARVNTTEIAAVEADTRALASRQVGQLINATCHCPRCRRCDSAG